MRPIVILLRDSSGWGYGQYAANDWGWIALGFETKEEARAHALSAGYKPTGQ